ncbi:hypothetical protein CIL05_04390 [Virgibacillus profundi]|uniref:Uncharacterized protein n=1 Tax=Virgibacillus profundi TaxID=2024555 RepID=A0A2A2IGS6_9BACI|nr:hypothetical protein [Virgibacillus profundi]PAV30959.1 hypothetical protein CIL05_04390 [Virgibacillus profundi]PXY55143.1 hypothetical protein CIT14_04475 [Virgibacillus profundi]
MSEERFDRLEKRFDLQDQKFDQMGKRFDLQDEKLDRMENMVTQLITTVAKVVEEQNAQGKEQNAMKEEQASIREELTTVKLEQRSMREESKSRHHVVMGKLQSIESDQDHIWEKAVRNEREFARFKNQFNF